MIKIGKFQQHEDFKAQLGANSQEISGYSRFSFLATQVLGCFNAKVQSWLEKLIEHFVEAKEYLWNINKNDDQIKDLLEDHIHQSISNGWDTVIKLNKFAIVAIVSLIFGFCNEEALRKRWLIIAIIFYSSTFIMNSISKRHPWLK